MKRNVSLTVILFVMLMAVATMATADVPNQMHYQGQLTDAGGAPLDTIINVIFTIYDDSSAGAAVWWTETQPNVLVDNGLFSALLGSQNGVPDSVFSDTTRWLGVTVGSDPEIRPRTRLVAVPYAYRVSTVDGASGGIIGGEILLRGEMRQIDPEGNTLCTLDSTDGGSGYIATHGANGSGNAVFTTVAGYPNNGGMGVLDSGSEFRAEMLISTAYNVGMVQTYGPNGNRNARLTYLTAHPDHGYIAVTDASGADLGGLYVDADSCGAMIVRGQNGGPNVYCGNANFEGPNYGYMAVHGAGVGINPEAGMYVNTSGQGIVWGDTKNFRIPNPNQADTDIWYCSLEGPEAAAYVRGTGHLANGRADVTLPDHFVAVASSQGITVQVTPLSAESKGLAVVEKSPETFAVRELNNGSGTYDFDFMVTAVRKGHEDYQVIRPAMEMPSPELGAAAEGSEILLRKGSRR